MTSFSHGDPVRVTPDAFDKQSVLAHYNNAQGMVTEHCGGWAYRVVVADGQLGVLSARHLAIDSDPPEWVDVARMKLFLAGELR